MRFIANAFPTTSEPSKGQHYTFRLPANGSVDLYKGGSNKFPLPGGAVLPPERGDREILGVSADSKENPNDAAIRGWDLGSAGEINSGGSNLWGPVSIGYAIDAQTRWRTRRSFKAILGEPAYAASCITAGATRFGCWTVTQEPTGLRFRESSYGQVFCSFNGNRATTTGALR